MPEKTDQELVADLVKGIASHPKAFSNVLGVATAYNKNKILALKAGASIAFSLGTTTISAAKKLYDKHGATAFVEALLENGLLTELTKIPKEQSQAIIDQLISPLSDPEHKHHNLVKKQLKASGYDGFKASEVRNAFNLMLELSNYLARDEEGNGLLAVEILEKTLSKRMKYTRLLEDIEESKAKKTINELKESLKKQTTVPKELKAILNKKIKYLDALKEFKEALKKESMITFVPLFQETLDKTNEDIETELVNTRDVITSYDHSLLKTMINSLNGKKDNKDLTPLIPIFIKTLNTHTELKLFHSSLKEMGLDEKKLERLIETGVIEELLKQPALLKTAFDIYLSGNLQINTNSKNTEILQNKILQQKLINIYYKDDNAKLNDAIEYLNAAHSIIPSLISQDNFEFIPKLEKTGNILFKHSKEIQTAAANYQKGNTIEAVKQALSIAQDIDLQNLPILDKEIIDLSLRKYFKIDELKIEVDRSAKLFNNQLENPKLKREFDKLLKAETIDPKADFNKGITNQKILGLYQDKQQAEENYRKAIKQHKEMSENATLAYNFIKDSNLYQDTINLLQDLVETNPIEATTIIELLKKGAPLEATSLQVIDLLSKAGLPSAKAILENPSFPKNSDGIISLLKDNNIALSLGKDLVTYKSTMAPLVDILIATKDKEGQMFKYGMNGDYLIELGAKIISNPKGIEAIERYQKNPGGVNALRVLVDSGTVMEVVSHVISSYIKHKTNLEPKQQQHNTEEMSIALSPMHKAGESLNNAGVTEARGRASKTVVPRKTGKRQLGQSLLKQ